MNFLLVNITDGSRATLAVIGLAAFAGGVWMMIRHKHQIDDVFVHEKDKRLKRLEQSKFRRRSWASTMIASMGILMVSLYWARDPYVFASLISVVLILLLAVMLLAVLDLMSVSLQAVTETDEPARKALVKEYLRQREKLVDQVEAQDESD